MNPYLSIVATSRNDNHGGDLTKRMKIFVRGLIHQTQKFKLETELILVEWNPPDHAPLLHEELKFNSTRYLSIRYIVVPEDIHKTYKTGAILPIFQMIAKNIGIRRAKAPYILCTNIDLLFSDKLFHFLAKKELKPGNYYRCNRCDIPKDIDENETVENQLSFAKNNIIQRLGKNRLYPNFDSPHKIFYHNLFFRFLIFLVTKINLLFDKKNTTLKKSVDTFACGDFTLMSKKDWIDIQGYLELDAYSIHVDSLALYSALALGKKQVILPPQYQVFHISHDDGWELQDVVSKIKFDIKLPMLDWSTARNAGHYMIDSQSLVNLNKPTWGFVNIDFKEIAV